MYLKDFLINNQSAYYPILGNKFDYSQSVELDFTEKNTEIIEMDLTNTNEFSKYVFDKIEKEGATFGIGGYLENRAIYRRSEHFNSGEEPRTFHLGVDIWLGAGSSIYAPLSGKVHSYANNNNFGDYGPTIILEHAIEGYRFYTLYGHLSLQSIDNLSVGKYYEAGESLAHIGDYPENGDWPPHLHFQIIEEIGDYWGDYPGVCRKSEREFYAANCPDPNLILGIV
ncbi:MAG: peptidoglycan DD-metalloendopeptidase family protein [Bacteroidota bacterium]